MDSSEQVNMTTIEEEEPVIELTPALVQKRRSQGRIIFDRFVANRTALGGAIFLILMLVICFLGPYITGHNDPNALHLEAGAGAFAPPSWQYPFGTDDVGRDQLARAMAGGQVSLKCADENRRARRFYDRLGFVEIDRGEDAGHSWTRLRSP